MLRIHNDPMAQFREDVRAAFAEEMRAHPARSSPPLRRADGDGLHTARVSSTDDECARR